MDAQTIIETLQRDVKDKTLLIRLYNLHNGTDLWIDGLLWRLYDFDLKEYLHEEFGIDLPVGTALSFDILDADTDLVKQICFNKGVFSRTNYDLLNEALVEMSDDAILAGHSLGIDLEKMADAYRGSYKSFEQYVEQCYTETCLEEVRPVLKYFDWSKVAEEWEQEHLHHEGHVFDATR